MLMKDDVIDDGVGVARDQGPSSTNPHDLLLFELAL